MRTVALFIDGDNVSAEYAGTILERAEKLGEVVVRRVYGDAALQSHWDSGPALRFIHAGHSRSAIGRLLASDAMEALSTDAIDVFVLVGPDGEFARLAHRIRDKGKRIIGISERREPEPVRKNRMVQKLLRTFRKPPEGGASGLDWSIRDVVLKLSGTTGSAPLRLFGLYMWNSHRTRLADISETSWRDYLRARHALFEVVEAPGGARVRYKPEGFLAASGGPSGPFPSRTEPVSSEECRTTP